MCHPDEGRVGVKERVEPVVVVPRMPEASKSAGVARIDTMLERANLAVLARLVGVDGKLKVQPAEPAVQVEASPQAKSKTYAEAAPQPQRKEVPKPKIAAPVPAMTTGKSPSAAKAPAATPGTVQLATKLRVTLQEALAEAKRMSREPDRRKKFESRDETVRKLCAVLEIQFTKNELNDRTGRENLWRRVKQEVVKTLGETSADRLLPNFLKFSDRDE